MSWKQLDDWLRHYSGLIIWPVLIIGGLLFYQHVETVRAAIKTAGIYRKAVVTSTFVDGSVWTVDVRYRYKDSLYDAQGHSGTRYAEGDSILIKFSPQYPSEVDVADSITAH